MCGRSRSTPHARSPIGPSAWVGLLHSGVTTSAGFTWAYLAKLWRDVMEPHRSDWVRNRARPRGIDKGLHAAMVAAGGPRHLGVGFGDAADRVSPGSACSCTNSVPGRHHPGRHHRRARLPRPAPPQDAGGGGLVSEDRLRRSLLSSQPMCFNLFGHFQGADAAGLLLPWVRWIRPCVEWSCASNSNGLRLRRSTLLEGQPSTPWSSISSMTACSVFWDSSASTTRSSRSLTCGWFAAHTRRSRPTPGYGNRRPACGST